MEPFEIMVSESQERMLCVVEPERVGDVLGGLRALGDARHADRRGHRRRPAAGARRAARSSPTCRSPCWSTTARSTTSSRRRPARRCLRRRRRAVLDGDESPAETLLALLGSPNLASRRPVFEQYDPVVQSRTVRRPEEADAAVLALPDGAAIAVSIDGNGRRVACDPRRGAAEAVYECAANLACVGAEPLGLTNCLNFGNPEKPHVAWQLAEAVAGAGRGLRGARACRSSAATSRSTTRRRPARSSPPRWSGWSARCPTRPAPAGSASRARATRSRWSARSPPRRAGSELAKLRGEASAGRCRRSSRRGRARRRTPGPRRGCARGRCTAPTTSPRAASRWRWPSAASPAGSARGRLPDGLDPFAEAPGRAFVVSGPAEALGRTGADRRGSGATTLEIEGAARARSFRAARRARARARRVSSRSRC